MAKEPEGTPALLPEVQKAFWLSGELHARFSAMLERRRRKEPRLTERALFAEAVTMLVERGERSGQ